MNLKNSRKKKYLILGTIGSGVLVASIVTPLVILNNKNDKVNKEDEDINKIVKILKNKPSKEKIIELPNNASGKIIANNQDKIIEKIKTLIGKVNLKKVKIEVLMKNDTNISTSGQKIIIKLTKNEVSKEIEGFLVKKKNAIDEDIAAIKKVLDAKNDDDLIINLPSYSTGKIIGNIINKNAIERRLRELIDSSNKIGYSNHSSLRGTTIEISMKNDAPISTIAQNIIVSITKTGGKTLKTTKTFKVKRHFTANEDIAAIKKVLDAKTGEDLKIILPVNSTGNIIRSNINKNLIIKKLKELIDFSNVNGEDNHPSLRGTTIEVSMDEDVPISTSFQDIIVSISKTNGQTIRTSKIFQVRKKFTNNELANKDIESIKNILDAKTGEDLKIILPSNSTGNIIENAINKNTIEQKLRELIDPLNINGKTNHPSLKGTTISISMSVDAPISTIPQNIIVSISKSGGTTLKTTSNFRVKREFIIGEIDENIRKIKSILDSKTEEDLTIILPGGSTGHVIGNSINKDLIKQKLRKLIDPSNANGEANHKSLLGTTIEISIDVDSWISTIPQNIIVSITKTGGTTLKTTKTFWVKREFTIDEINEDIRKIKLILDSKTDENLIIALPSDSTGNVIGKTANRDAIEQKLRKLIDPSNVNGDVNHPSLKGTRIEVSIYVDGLISTTPQNIIVSISKSGGTTLETTSIFKVKREFTIDEIDQDIREIKSILDSKTGDDLIIILSSNSTGNIIENVVNKNAIEQKLRKLIDPLNVNGNINHSSLKGTKIEVSMNVDAPISTIPQNIIVSIIKLNRIYIITKTFQVKRDFNNNELVNNDIESIKTILDVKTGEDLKIILASDSTGNIIENVVNKNTIEQKLRKLIDPLNVNGEDNHPSLKGTTIEVSMNVDAPISTTLQNIIVTISKIGGNSVTTTKTFQVKRDFTVDEDILSIKTILDAKTGEDLKIILASDSTGNIIENVVNKNTIEQKLRKLIDPLNVNGDANHPSLRETTIEVSMDVDAPISTALQNIIVKINKAGGNSVTTSKTFQVNRYDRINEEISKIKTILDAKTGEDLKIILASDSSGNIIKNVVNKNAIKQKLRELIDPLNTNGEANHESLLGTTIEVSMNVDKPISTTLQSIIVTINKIGGNSVTTTKIFQVKREFTIDEDILAIKNILDAKSGEDLKIILSDDSSGNIIENVVNKNAIEQKLRKLIDPLNVNGDANHPSLRGTKIEVSMIVNKSISIDFKDIIVTINKSGGTTLRTTNIFQVKREFTNAEKITNYFANKAKKTFTIFGGETLNTKAKILVAIKKHLAIDDPNLWTNIIQSLINVDNNETTNKIVKENYNETSFSITYNDDYKMIQSIELKIKHLRTKIGNKIIVNNLYDYYNNKWNTKTKALIITFKNVNRWWIGSQIKKAVNDATQDIYLQNKVRFDVNRVFWKDDSLKPLFVTNSEKVYFNLDLNTPRKFRVLFYSGKGQRAFSRSMNIFIKAIRK